MKTFQVQKRHIKLILFPNQEIKGKQVFLGFLEDFQLFNYLGFKSLPEYICLYRYK